MGVARIIPTAANPDLLTYTIKVEGEEVPRTYHIANISVHKEINKVPSARIKIFDGNPSEEKFEISDSDTFVPGKKIEISLGYHSEETTVFKGIIISHSNKITATSSELVIECKDAAIKMTVGKNSKHFNAVTDSDVAEELIGKYSDVTADVESTTIQHKDLVQFDTTDWDFVVSRMDSIGRICIVNDGTFTIRKPVLSAQQKLDVLFGATILEYNAHIDSRNQFKAVQSTSWDFSSQEITEADGAEPSWTEGGNISNADLADVIGLEKYKLIHSGKITQEELQAWADAKLMKQRLSKIKGSVKYQGNADVLPGDFIGLNGVGNRFNGKAIVNSIHHDCTDGMWSTEVHFGLETDWFAEKVDNKISRLLCMSASSLNISTCADAFVNVGGKLHPVPKKDFISFIFYPPISTVGHPTTIVPPCAVESPILAAGLPPINTVAEPIMMLSGGPVHTHISPTQAAGIPPINTVGAPGGNTGPPT